MGGYCPDCGNTICICKEITEGLKAERDSWKGMYMLCNKREAKLIAERDGYKSAMERLAEMCAKFNWDCPACGQEMVCKNELCSCFDKSTN